MAGVGPVLWIAAHEGNLKGVQKLLGGGGVNLEITSGALQSTPLLIAAKSGHLMIVINLIDHGTNVLAVDRDGWSAVHYACFEGHLSTLLVLIHHGANVSIKDRNGVSALMLAARNGHDLITEILLYNGANLHALDNNQETALHYAAGCGHENIVTLLIAHGACLHTTSPHRTPESMATSHGHTHVAAIIREEASSISNAKSRKQQRRVQPIVENLSHGMLTPLRDIIACRPLFKKG